MVLFADWLRQSGGDPEMHMVLTVDHGLRPGSGAEAEAVAAQAAALGFAHTTLHWLGEKPATGVQAAARDARYRLMREHMRAHGIGTLLTAHTLDDQAETLLMRLARGSGLDGLAAIAPSGTLAGWGPDGAHAVAIVRPLLGFAKARLRATLEARGISWCEDPSNELSLFERTRLRAAREALEALGLTSDMLALSARRLRRARAALEAATEQAWSGPDGLVHADPCGVLTLDRDRLCRLPEEIALRLVGGCVAAAGGLQEPPALRRLEPVVARLRQREEGRPGHWTLARALVTATLDAVRIEREPGRQPLPRITVAGGTKALWDGRFVVAVAESCSASCEVRALGAEGVRQLRDFGLTLEAARPLRLAPSFWQGDRLLAVPAVDFWASGELKGRLSTDFLGLRCNRAPPGAP
jgi:tRNA(Ile)-lysidine synthase